MKVAAFFLVAFCGFSVLGYAQNTGAPDWINNPVTVENGLILFTGYSAAFSALRMTYERAQRNALSNLIRKINANELSGLPPIPADAKTRSSFSSRINNRNVKGTIADISIVDLWQDDDGGVYVLCSSTGIELAQEEPQKKSLEEMDPMELYLHSLELEK